MGLFGKKKVCVTYRRDDAGETTLEVGGLDYRHLDDEVKLRIMKECFCNIFHPDDFEEFMKWYVSYAVDVYSCCKEGDRTVWTNKIWIKL